MQRFDPPQRFCRGVTASKDALNQVMVRRLKQDLRERHVSPTLIDKLQMPQIAANYELDRDQKKHLRYEAIRAVELVDSVSRLCAMNLFLHGIGPDDNHIEPPIKTDDSLRNEPSQHFPPWLLPTHPSARRAA